MTTPEEIAARREAWDDDPDNVRPDYPASAGLLEATKDAATLRRERDALRAEVERVKRAAKTLGQTIDKQCQMVLDATGLHDWVGEDGDGDWGAIWDHLLNLKSRAETAEAIVARVEALADRLASTPGGKTGVIGWFPPSALVGDVVADLRAALEGGDDE